MRQSTSRWLATVGLLLVLASPALACEVEHLTAKDDGVYIAESYARKAIEKRNVYETGHEGAFFVIVKEGHAQLSNAHEIWEPKTDEYFEAKKIGERIELVPIKGSPTAFTKVKTDAASHLFDKLFAGCYLDQTKQKLCMRSNRIVEGKKSQSAELLIDASELDIRGNNLKVEGDRLHWVFMPTAQGWNVYRSDWASAEGYKPFDEAKPWKTLTRQ